MSTATLNGVLTLGSETPDWQTAHDEMLANSPKPGTILRTADGSQAGMEISESETEQPFIFGKAYVPSDPNVELGWYLQPATVSNPYGHVCVLLPRARDEWVKRHGRGQTRGTVMALRVIRISQSGKALLCEVEEYAPYAPLN